MNIDGWKYYNHAAVPTSAPHKKVEMAPIQDGSIWKLSGHPILARWTESWDCKEETSFWYVIKDTPYDISSLKSKRRYEINKGKKNFSVRRINPKEFVDEIFGVAEKAFAVYPEKYRPNLDKVQFVDEIKTKWDKYSVFGAFNDEDILSMF